MFEIIYLGLKEGKVGDFIVVNFFDFEESKKRKRGDKEFVGNGEGIWNFDFLNF